MRIENLRHTRENGRPGVAADIIWEDAGLEQQTFRFETDAAFADDLACNPHAFIVAALIPAMHFGERRIVLKHEICPELYEGLLNALHWIRRWFYQPTHHLPVIETPICSKLAHEPKIERAGFFFSGGIDSYATFFGNRRRFADAHPYAIKDGLLVYGLEIYDPTAFGYVQHKLKQAADELGIALIPVYTNAYLGFRQEDAKNNFSFWINELMGATFAAIAHLFSQRLSVVSIASNADIAHLGPLGSHPLLDGNYSSCDLKIRHDGAYRTRYEKTRLVADQDVALKYLRVCNLIRKYTADSLNCGVCAKCVKTKLTLLAFDALDKADAFENKAIDPGMVKSGALIYDDYTEATYEDLIGPLESKGRKDLADAIRFCLNRYRRERSGCMNELKRIDKKYFSGSCERIISGVRKKISLLK